MDEKPKAPAESQRDPEEEGSAAKRPQQPTPRSRDPEEEGSAARPEK